jgi:hypothetical protein
MQGRRFAGIGFTNSVAIRLLTILLASRIPFWHQSDQLAMRDDCPSRVLAVMLALRTRDLVGAIMNTADFSYLVLLKRRPLRPSANFALRTSLPETVLCTSRLIAIYASFSSETSWQTRAR